MQHQIQPLEFINRTEYMNKFLDYKTSKRLVYERPKNDGTITITGDKWLGETQYARNYKPEKYNNLKPVVKGKAIIDHHNNTKSCVHSTIKFPVEANAQKSVYNMAMETLRA